MHFGFWEPNISALIESILLRGDVFVDIGANIGYDALLAAKSVGAEGSVIAIEASPKTFEILSMHISENHARNVRIVNKAVSDTPGKLMLYRGLPNNIGTVTTIRSRGFDEEGVVESLPLDHILSSDECSRLHLIKIDIEGGELPVLNRFLQTIDMYPKEIQLIVEVNPQDNPQEWSDVFTRFRAAGFSLYLIENPYTYDAYFNWAGLTPLRLVEGIPSRQTDILFKREK